MKKVIMGSIMMLSGILSIAIIIAGATVHDWTINGQYSAMWNISRYGLIPYVVVFSIIAVVGLLVAIWGVIEKK